jgi:hypothetical protein
VIKLEAINPTTSTRAIVIKKPKPGILKLKTPSIVMNIKYKKYIVAAAGRITIRPSKKYLVSFFMVTSFFLIKNKK